MKDNKLIHLTFKLNLGKEQALKWPKASIRQVMTVYETILSRFVYAQSSPKAHNSATVTLNLHREKL
jgi:hypothetical protein